MNRRSVEPNLQPGETAVEYLQRMEKEKLKDIHGTIPHREPDVRRSDGSPPSGFQPPQYQQPHPPHDGAAAPPPQEVVFYEGYKLSRDFFTCVALCIMKLNDPEINKIFETFGFEMKDLNGKPIKLSPGKPQKASKKRKKKK